MTCVTGVCHDGAESAPNPNESQRSGEFCTHTTMTLENARARCTPPGVGVSGFVLAAGGLHSARAVCAQTYPRARAAQARQHHHNKGKARREALEMFAATIYLCHWPCSEARAFFDLCYYATCDTKLQQKMRVAVCVAGFSPSKRAPKFCCGHNLCLNSTKSLRAVVRMTSPLQFLAFPTAALQLKSKSTTHQGVVGGSERDDDDDQARSSLPLALQRARKK